ncbi:hypothetical protein C7B80_30080 [Cyanosarcina cf. burmensis CCALA 770]|nr:hypothetical protein C7B80_30080 [Cyanosarcina cf. burmensis CCALA 770]
MAKTAERVDNIAGTGGSMHTKVEIADSGQITGTTRTWTKVDLRGFTGSVQVVVFTPDRNGWISRVYSYGVSGEFFGGNDRTEVWQENMPSEIASKVDRVVIIHNWNPQWDRLLKDILSGARQFSDAYDELAGTFGPFMIALS